MIRTRWTDEKLEAALRQECRVHGRFPTCRELRDRGRNDLACKVSKTLGFIGWAKRLGVPRQTSDSDFGWAGERWLVDMLNSRGFEAVRSTAVKAPFDVMVNGLVRVDVKTARAARYHRKRPAWHYRIGKVVQADLVVLVRMDENDCLFIPWWECGTTNITVSPTLGKNKRWHMNFDVLRTMLADRRATIERIERAAS